MIASPCFGARILHAGIAFTPLGVVGDFESLLQRAELCHPRKGARFLIDELLKRLPEAFAVTAALSQPRDTVLVGSSLSWGLRLVQEHSGLPAATVHLSPICLQSASGPSVLPGVGDLSWLPAWAVRALQSGAEQLFVDLREQLPAVLPAGALHVSHAPFSALLPRLSALVHHGGIGTSAQALAAGIPQLVVPFAHDQFDNAARLHRLGVAVRLRTQAPAAEWRDALQGLLEAPGRTAALRCNAARMTAEGPAAARIAEQLEQLEGASRSPQQPCAAGRLNSHGGAP